MLSGVRLRPTAGLGRLQGLEIATDRSALLPPLGERRLVLVAHGSAGLLGCPGRLLRHADSRFLRRLGPPGASIQRASVHPWPDSWVSAAGSDPVTAASEGAKRVPRRPNAATPGPPSPRDLTAPAVPLARGIACSLLPMEAHPLGRHQPRTVGLQSRRRFPARLGPPIHTQSLWADPAPRCTHNRIEGEPGSSVDPARYRAPGSCRSRAALIRASGVPARPVERQSSCRTPGLSPCVEPSGNSTRGATTHLLSS